MSDPTEKAAYRTINDPSTEVEMPDKKLRNVIEYHSNNSGGDWWLDDGAWQALADAGWIVHWVHDLATPHGDFTHGPEHTHLPNSHYHGYTDPLLPSESNGERWLGALARSAAKETTDPAAAIAEWECLTSQSASAQGCNCCGSPHSFTFYDADGNSRYSSVEVVSTELSWS